MYILSAALFLCPFDSTAQSPSNTPQKAPLNLEKAVDDDFGKLPTYIKADTLTLKSLERVFAYSGNVEVRQGDLTLTCDIVEGKYSEKNQIEELTARNNVTVLKGENIRVTGQRAVYDAAAETITMSESPELQQNDSILTADSIKVFLKENRSVAEGAVRVKVVKKDGIQGPGSVIPIK